MILQRPQRPGGFLLFIVIPIIVVIIVYLIIRKRKNKQLKRELEQLRERYN